MCCGLCCGLGEEGEMEGKSERRERGRWERERECDLLESSSETRFREL